jgi:hypothetical protein
MSRAPRRRPGPPPVDGRKQHLDWLALVEVTGPFLTLPVLRTTWPTLDALESEARDGLRAAHAAWRADPDDPTVQQEWIGWVLRDLLEWGDALVLDPAALATDTGAPSFALVQPGEDVKPDTTRLLGLLCPPGVVPTAVRRGDGDERAAAPVDELARLCRRHGVELGLATDGRWWTLVWAPVGGVTTTATFDAVTWPEQADRDVIRAFRSLLRRSRFFAVPDEETLVPMLRRSIEGQEEVTEALGVQVRQAVELLVDAIGRADARARERGGEHLGDVPAQDVYRGAVAVMMRVVFLLFAEERGLLPADNDLYQKAYSAGRLWGDLDEAARAGSEEDLEHSGGGWMRLLALFQAVYAGVTHPRLTLPAYDGSIFDPATFPWMADLRIDDRTVLHMLRAVQRVTVHGEDRTLSFRALDVEQIGYVYEGLLSFEGRRADDTVVGLIGKRGLEEEASLADLVAHAVASPTVPELAARLAEAYKDSKIGTPAALARKLAPLPEGERADALRRLLAVTGGDLGLAEQLLPFVGILRTDLRGLPVVIQRDSLYVTESRLRKNTGTHYTPRFLAEQVVEGALEPLVYSPGPLETADKATWKLRSAEEILALKVADIAMGSGAFLVAACRYLAGKLLEISGVVSAAPTDGPVLDSEADPVVIAARREIIEHCLYGVDINPMAVEMAKLSLWLVSMDPHRPFTFLDDRLVAGDSLLGVTSLDQVEYMHLDPAAGRKIHESTLKLGADVRSIVAEVIADRAHLRALPGDSLAQLTEKRGILAAVEAKTAQVRLYADLVVGAALAGARKSAGSKDPNAREDQRREGLSRKDDLFWEASYVAGNGDDEAARGKANRWLTTELPVSGFARYPLHWPLAFPEVFEAGGFDAIVGNPPFLGGKKISGATGSAYREYLVEVVGQGVKGNADLVAYFLLRASRLLGNTGQTGLIATNTLSQGDTREVGLDRVVEGGSEIRRAIKSEPWPSNSAVLQYCAVWTSRRSVEFLGERLLNGRAVAGITPTLDETSRTAGNPYRLLESKELAFIGSYVLGSGFLIDADKAERLRQADPRNAEVLFPFLNGQDLNSRPDYSASRWAIDFDERSEAQSRTYSGPWEIVEQHVRPERLKQDAAKYPRMVYEWWKYWRPRGELRAAMAEFHQVIAITLVSKVVMPVLVPRRQVFSHALGVIATDDTAMLGLMSSAPHYWWAISRASTMKGDLRYTPSDVFETLARPSLSEDLRRLGKWMQSYRQELMSARQAGLTATYNLVHSPACTDVDIATLREIHVAIDREVLHAYAWDDIEPDHGFHETRQGVRFTVGPVARQEILDRLLELNHERYAAEVDAGLHEKKKPAVKKKAAAEQEGLFGG